jgi:hypothetical protein
MTPHWPLVLASIATAATGLAAIAASVLTAGHEHKGEQQ